MGLVVQSRVVTRSKLARRCTRPAFSPVVADCGIICRGNENERHRDHFIGDISRRSRADGTDAAARLCRRAARECGD